MAVGGTQPTLRKYLGALKDTTTVSLAKVNSDYKVQTFFMIHLNNFRNVSSSDRPSVHLLGTYHSFLLQDLDIAIVKATNHVERPSKEKYIRGNHVSWLKH